MEDIFAPTEPQNVDGVHGVAGQQNMHGLVCSPDLHMDLAETDDDVMVRQND